MRSVCTFGLKSGPSPRQVHGFYVEGLLLLDLKSGFAPAAKFRFPPFVPLVTSGPLLLFTSTSECCSVARHCGHSYILQHFGGSNVGLRCGFNRSLGLLQRLLCITNVVRALPSVFPFSLSNKMCRCLWYVPIMKVWKILSWDDCIAQRLSKSSAKS